MIKAMLFTLVMGTTLSPTMRNASTEVDLSRLYSSTMMVTNITELENETYLLELEDYNGFIWEYETDGDDWFIGDCASVIMDNMNTPLIFDDEIVSINYDAWYLTR